MIVKHNLTAMNSNRMLGLTTNAQAKSTEKLASGYKINRAADDAAGLSISEKMRRQVRGLTQASANAQDGISAVQTAEGALTEVHDMLQRMNELAVKADNGTMSADDRQNVQDEINQLVKEIDRVSETTKFNETYLLKGSDTPNKNSRNVEAAGSVGNFNGYTVTKDAAGKIETGGALVLGTVGLKSLDNTVLTNNNGVVTNASAASSNITSVTVADFVSAADCTVIITKKDGTTESLSGTDASTKYGFAAKANGTTAIEKTLTTTDKTAGYTVTATASASLTGYEVGKKVEAKINVANDSTVTLYSKSAPKNPLEMNLHVGADSDANNKISLTIDSMDATTLGVRDVAGNAISVMSEIDAGDAIDTIAEAIKRVSTQRSALGAVQNRLEHTISNLDNVIENTTAAEAQIRDTNMAKEMVQYANNNILAQAGQSMLAQANQSNQGVLSLLG